MVIIRKANQGDNEGLLRLTELTPMLGEIGIRIDRKPDFFKLLNLLGNSIVIIAEENGEIIGCVSAVDEGVLIKGKHRTITYLGDLKIHPDYRKTRLAYRLIKFIWQEYEKIDVDIIFCTVSYGNDKIMPFFSGKAGFPIFEIAGIFHVLQILPSRFKYKSSKYKIMEIENFQDIKQLYSKFYSSYSFCSDYNNIPEKNIRHFAATDNEGIKAAVTLYDSQFARQNVLIHIPLIMNISLFALRFINSIYKFWRLPKLNNCIELLSVKSFAFTEEEAFKFLMKKVRNIAFDEDYMFILIGLHEKDMRLKLFKKFPKFVYKSIGFVAGIKTNSDGLHEIFDGISFYDYSLH